VGRSLAADVTSGTVGETSLVSVDAIGDHVVVTTRRVPVRRCPKMLMTEFATVNLDGGAPLTSSDGVTGIA
jgi:hypothetical protein